MVPDLWKLEAYLGEALEELEVLVPQGAEKRDGGDGKGRAARASPASG